MDQRDGAFHVPADGGDQFDEVLTLAGDGVDQGGERLAVPGVDPARTSARRG